MFEVNASLVVEIIATNVCYVILSVTLTDNRTGIEKKRGEENLKNGAVLRGAFPYTEL